MSKWRLKIDGKVMDVEVEESTAGHYYVKVGGKEHKVIVDEADWGLPITPVEPFPLPGAYPGAVPAVSARPARPGVKAQRPAKVVRATKPALPPESHAAMPRLPAVESPPPVAISGKSIPSPMPGKVIKILVNVGDEVKAGDGICVLESMKMENTIPSPRDGRIVAFHVKAGDSTNTGSPIADIE